MTQPTNTMSLNSIEIEKARVERRFSMKGMRSDIPLVLLQFVIQAFDENDPAAKATATVTINVDRNANAPVFDKNVYTATIHETRTLGDVFETVKAEDKDVSIW